MLSPSDTLASQTVLARFPGRVVPPQDFGLTWTHLGEHKRYGHVMDLWDANGASEAYRTCWKREREALTDAGFSWTDKGRSDDAPFTAPCWWRMSNPALDLLALQAAVDRALAAEAEVVAKREADRIRREAEEDERIGPRVAVIRARLKALLATDAWQLGKAAQDAREHLDAGRWDESNLGYAEGLLSDAAGNAARAEGRIAKPNGVWFERAGDPLIRAAALEGCRVLSARDADWASEVNGRGWSQSTTWAGHALAGRETLTQTEASHALALLHGHRRQLPADLRARIFEDVEPAPSLFLL